MKRWSQRSGARSYRIGSAFASSSHSRSASASDSPPISRAHGPTDRARRARRVDELGLWNRAFRSLSQSVRQGRRAGRERLLPQFPVPSRPDPSAPAPGQLMDIVGTAKPRGPARGRRSSHRQLGRAGVVARAEPLPDLAPTPRSTRAQGVARPDRCSHLRTRASDSGLAASGSGAAPLRQGAAPTPQSPSRLCVGTLVFAEAVSLALGFRFRAGRVTLLLTFVLAK